MSELAVFFTLKDRQILVVGATPAAFARAMSATQAGANVTIVDPNASIAFTTGGYSSSEQLTLHDRLFNEHDLNGKSLVFVATDNTELSETIGTWASFKNIPVNVLDRPDLSSFLTPATVKRGPVQIAISTGGKAPVLARRLRLLIEGILPASLGELVEKVGSVRTAVKAFIPNLAERRHFWDNIFEDADKWQNASEKDIKDAASNNKAPRGRVALVGAGPGDAELLTLKAQRLLSNADVILYDRLVSADVLKHARVDAERIYVGKKQSDHGIGQKGIEKLLLTHARAGKLVVRLKGGDPMLFARAGEELTSLREHNVPVEIVPGITALAGIAASSQIPLTDRKVADALTLITGQRATGEKQDWSGLAGPGRTLAIYMGLRDVAETSDALIEDGVSAAIPIAIIENGTRADERRFYGRLDELSGLVELHKIKSPALIIIGDVVLQAADLHVEVPFAVAA